MKVIAVTPDLDSGTVMLAEQVAGFKRVLVTAQDEERRIEVTAEATSDGYVCSRIEIDGGGHPVTGDAIRRIPVASLVREAASFTFFKGTPDDPGVITDWRTWPPFVIAEWPDGDLDTVARWTAMTYAAAVFHGIGPTKAVREAAGVSQATAGRLIRDARERGVLTTPPPRRSGGSKAHVGRDDG